MTYTQDDRLISIDTPLGKDILLLQGFTGHEGMSQLFNFNLDLLAETHSIPFNKLIGQKVTLAIRTADGRERYFNGVISRFAQSGADARFTSFRAEVVPWLWFLTRTTDCRIFQNMTVPDIITKIFKDLGFTDFKNKLEGTFEPRDYCVQYRETDFNFVSRLMEQYGIFYFFEHEEKKHTLVLANSANVHQPCPGQPEARCDFSTGAMLEEDVIVGWQMEQELRPGKYALTDYNFETPSTSLAVNVASTINVGGNGKYEVYDYPGEYLKKAEGERLAKIRMQEEEAPHVVVNGYGSCRAFTPGYRFDLVGHYSAQMDKCYVLTEVRHVASVGESYWGRDGDTGESYSNHFTCIPHDVPFCPTRVTPKPTVQGPQTAIVVGRSGEEIYTDKYGRVKVQFHWDREGKRDENSSCWIRVSHPWAGKGWGAVAIPRIGQEVVVDFLEGDPDQPIITGRVYNAEQMPPYALPANQTQSGIKSRSSKDGTPDNFNEIRFEDKKGEEQLYIHAEKNQDIHVENDESHFVGHDRKKEIINDERVSVGRDRTESVQRNENISIGNDRTENVERNEKISIGGDRNTDVNKNEDVVIGENRTESITKNEKITIGDNREEYVGKDEKLEVAGNRFDQIAKDDKQQIGEKFALVAGDQILLQTGDASIVMKKNGDIQIKGKNITLIGSGKISIKASGDVVLKGSKIAEN
jgi:type VI secretion system secreted protein VgrG